MSPITSWTAINWDFIKMGKAKRACFRYVYINDTQAHTHKTDVHTHIYILLIKKQVKKIIPVGKSKNIFFFQVQNKYPFPYAVHKF